MASKAGDLGIRSHLRKMRSERVYLLNTEERLSRLSMDLNVLVHIIAEEAVQVQPLLRALGGRTQLQT